MRLFSIYAGPKVDTRELLEARSIHLMRTCSLRDTEQRVCFQTCMRF